MAKAIKITTNPDVINWFIDSPDVPLTVDFGVIQTLGNINILSFSGPVKSNISQAYNIKLGTVPAEYKPDVVVNFVLCDTNGNAFRGWINTLGEIYIFMNTISPNYYSGYLFGTIIWVSN